MDTDKINQEVIDNLRYAIDKARAAEDLNLLLQATNSLFFVSERIESDRRYRDVGPVPPPPSE